MPTFHDDYVVIDLETTGLSTKNGARVVWISALKINKKNIVEKSFWILKTDAYVIDTLSEIIGINQLDLQTAHPVELVLPDFFRFVKDLPLVTHFAAFVAEFMEHECSLWGYEGFLRYVCTYEMARKAFPLEKNSIDTLVKRLGIEVLNTESSIYDDTFQVYQIYEKLKESLT